MKTDFCLFPLFIKHKKDQKLKIFLLLFFHTKESNKYILTFNVFLMFQSRKWPKSVRRQTCEIDDSYDKGPFQKLNEEWLAQTCQVESGQTRKYQKDYYFSLTRPFWMAIPHSHIEILNKFVRIFFAIPIQNFLIRKNRGIQTVNKISQERVTMI